MFCLSSSCGSFCCCFSGDGFWLSGYIGAFWFNSSDWRFYRICSSRWLSMSRSCRRLYFSENTGGRNWIFIFISIIAWWRWSKLIGFFFVFLSFIVFCWNIIVIICNVFWFIYDCRFMLFCCSSILGLFFLLKLALFLFLFLILMIILLVFLLLCIWIIVFSVWF